MSSCVLFILDCMNSVGIAELNNVFNVFISVCKRKNDPRVKNVFILLVRSVWNFQQAKPEVIERLRMKTLYWKFHFVKKSLLDILRIVSVRLKSFLF